MATTAQIHANRENSRHSTGPVTEAGKAAAARNRLTFGLYTESDYVKPEEQGLYQDFRQTFRAELNPLTLIEETLVNEITGASWRLRRAAAAEATLGDFDDDTDKTRRSIERARAAAQCALNRAINQLRKIQTEGALASNCKTRDTRISNALASNCKQRTFIFVLFSISYEDFSLGCISSYAELTETAPAC